jgi:hypothetical protein
MTTERLREILSSKPRKRVATIVARWLVVAALTPLKLALKLPALPFLALSNLMWKVERKMLWDVGSILQELADERIREEIGEDGYDDDDEVW